MLELAAIDDEALPRAEIRVVFFDIDGTLLGLDGQYTQASIEQIRRLQNAGIATAVASGRPYFAAKFIVESLGLYDPGVLCAGAHIVDPRSNETLYCATIDKTSCLQLTQVLRELDIHYEIYTESAYFIERDNVPEIREIHTQHMRVKPETCDFLELIEQASTKSSGEKAEKSIEKSTQKSSVIKFLAAVPKPVLHETLNNLEKRFPALIFSYAGIASYPEWLFVSITSREATREAAFARMMEHYKVQPENVMSFGDAQSDCVFLNSAGIGVAMGNATDQAKASANYITKPVWEDGVAYALSRLVQ